MTGNPLEVAPGLLERFRSAGAQIEWRPAPGGRGRRKNVRVAHLFQEEARVVTRDELGGYCLTVDSGPVGALVLLLEADRRGRPRLLVAQNAGRDPGFPSGALVAAWGPVPDPRSDGPVGMVQLVELARYALP
ncbi:MAG: hypothetical protein WB809_07175 [Thermoplasmata archaeon]